MCDKNNSKPRRIKALCFVAHPDDCIIYAKPFIDATPYLDWSILYLTYSKKHPRGAEISEYWKCDTDFLELPDYTKDILTNKSAISEELILRLSEPYIENTDLLLTHGKDGEYGHIHHKLIHRACQFVNIAKVFFSDQGLMISNKQINTDSLPLHKRDILKYHNNVRMYDISSDARSIIIEAKDNDTR